MGCAQWQAPMGDPTHPGCEMPHLTPVRRDPRVSGRPGPEPADLLSPQECEILDIIMKMCCECLTGRTSPCQPLIAPYEDLWSPRGWAVGQAGPWPSAPHTGENWATEPAGQNPGEAGAGSHEQQPH